MAYIKNIYEWIRNFRNKTPKETDFVTLESNVKAHIQALKKNKISFKDIVMNIMWTIYIGLSFGLMHKHRDQKTFNPTGEKTKGPYSSVFPQIIAGIYFNCMYDAFGVSFVILLHGIYDLCIAVAVILPYLLTIMFIYNLGKRVFKKTKKGNNVKLKTNRKNKVNSHSSNTFGYNNVTLHSSNNSGYNNVNSSSNNSEYNNLLSNLNSQGYETNEKV